MTSKPTVLITVHWKAGCIGKLLTYVPCRNMSACHHKKQARQGLTSSSWRGVLLHCQKEASPYRWLPQTYMLPCCVLVMLLVLILQFWSHLWWVIIFWPVNCPFSSSFLCDRLLNSCQISCRRCLNCSGRLNNPCKPHFCKCFWSVLEPLRSEKKL